MNWEQETVSECAERAARRAIEAISRVGTLNTDFASLGDRVTALEASNRDLMSILGEVLGMLEAR